MSDAATAKTGAKTRWWLWPVAVLVVVCAFAAAYLISPGFNVLVRTAGNVLGTGDPAVVRIFIVTQGGRSPLALIALIAWQAVAFPLSEIPALQASGLLYGPILGTVVNWAGLLAGACLSFLVGRAVVGAAVMRFAPFKEPRLRIAPWVILGLRLIPFVPQDMVSLAAGATRTRFRDFFIPTAAVALAPSLFYAIYAEEAPVAIASAYLWTLLLAGAVVLGTIAWRYRSRIPWGTLSAERKRTLLVSTVLLAVAFGVYRFVPTFKDAVDAAVRIIASGDISAVRDYLLSFGVWAPIVSALLMILQSIAAPLPAFVVTFSNGMLFGWAWGALLSWSSAMAGAALCFWVARAFGRPVVEKLVGGSSALEVSDLFFDRYGERAVLIARLLPFVSFDIVSYGAGLTSMRFWPFFIATGIGQLPATLVYSYLGQNLTGSVRILFFVFLITTVIFVVIVTVRPIYLRRLREGSLAEETGA